MFEVHIMCEDNKLHKVLWALDGLIVGMPQMLPVRNAVANKDKTKVREKLPDWTSIIMRLWHRLEELHPSGETFTWEDAANILEPMNHSRPSTSSYLSRLIKTGKIIKVGTGRYKIK